MSWSTYLSVIGSGLAALICAAYATSLIVGFEMAEPKAVVYVAALGYWIDAMRRSLERVRRFCEICGGMVGAVAVLHECFYTVKDIEKMDHRTPRRDSVFCDRRHN